MKLFVLFKGAWVMGITSLYIDWISMWYLWYHVHWTDMTWDWCLNSWKNARVSWKPKALHQRWSSSTWIIYSIKDSWRLLEVSERRPIQYDLKCNHMTKKVSNLFMVIHLKIKEKLMNCYNSKLTIKNSKDYTIWKFKR